MFYQLYPIFGMKEFASMDICENCFKFHFFILCMNTEPSSWLVSLTRQKDQTRGPFHKSSYERFLLYEFVEPVFNYRSNEFVALTNLCETGPRP